MIFILLDNFTNNCCLNREKIYFSCQTGPFMEKFSADPIDLQILNLLQENANLTNKEIAAQLGLTITPVFERIRRLEREGVIEKYVALVSGARLGKGLVVFCEVSLVQHLQTLLHAFEERIATLREVVECYHIAGSYDYLLKVVVSDMAAYQQFLVGQLATLENLSRVQSAFVLTPIKSSTAIPL